MNAVIRYKDALAFPLIGVAIGLILDIDRKKHDFESITGNWIIMWKNTTP